MSTGDGRGRVRFAGVATLATLVVLVAWLTFALTLASALARPAYAHVRASEATSVVRQQGSTVQFLTSIEYRYLAAAAGIGLPPANDEARQRQLASGRDKLTRYLTSRIVVSLDGVQCEGVLHDATVEHRQSTTYIRSDLRYTCSGEPSGRYRIQYIVFTEDEAIVDNHTNVVEYQLGSSRGAFVFDQAHREFQTGGGSSPLHVAAGFVGFGVDHILRGLDHVLFLVVLLLGATTIPGVVKVATSFTAAHSLTLALGALGWVEIPGQIVEPLIALSIGYVAVENILTSETRHRLGVVFAFGLLHGLGFANSISLTGEFDLATLGALAGFNCGIELGQLMLIGSIFPILLFFRRFSWSGAAHTVVTAMAAIVAMTWYVQRLIGA
jgi:hypothetical protein